MRFGDLRKQGKTDTRYESPWGVMSTEFERNKTKIQELRIPMRGYEVANTPDLGSAEDCYESPWGVMR